MIQALVALFRNIQLDKVLETNLIQIKLKIKQSDTKSSIVAHFI